MKAVNAKGAVLEQAFNPISTDDTPGEVVLLVKVSLRSDICTPSYLLTSILNVSARRAQNASWDIQEALGVHHQVVIPSESAGQYLCNDKSMTSGEPAPHDCLACACLSELQRIYSRDNH